MKKKLSMQQTFEKVSRHLFEQGVPAMEPETGGCLYRGPNGTKCAMGCLIPDDQYKTAMDEEVGSVPGLMNMFPKLWDLFDSEDKYSWLHFLHALQKAHDVQSFKSYEDRYFNESKLKEDLEEVAKYYKLDSSFLSDLKIDRKY